MLNFIAVIGIAALVISIWATWVDRPRLSWGTRLLGMILALALILLSRTPS